MNMLMGDRASGSGETIVRPSTTDEVSGEAAEDVEIADAGSSCDAVAAVAGASVGWFASAGAVLAGADTTGADAVG
jgi:hypothetical protein